MSGLRKIWSAIMRLVREQGDLNERRHAERARQGNVAPPRRWF